MQKEDASGLFGDSLRAHANGAEQREPIATTGTATRSTIAGGTSSSCAGAATSGSIVLPDGIKPYYSEGGIVILHGDCREILPHVEADVVVTDPPYGVEFSGKRAKCRDGSVRLRPGGYSIPDTPEFIASDVAPALALCIARFGRVVVTPGTRNLWLYPPADDVGCWFSAAGTGIGRWGFTCMQPILYYGKDPHLPNGASANSIGQVYPNSSNEFDHPCAKPLPLVSWLVRKASRPGETVLDPFMGSGTTLRAAKDLGRKAIGIEIEERYCEIAAKRLAQGVFDFA